ncbi:MAG: lysophospholipid acyltransferase family protein [Burkholderiales bacterium]
MIVLRSLLFALLQAVITPLFALIALLTFPLDHLTRYHVITTWSRIIIVAARALCGIRYRIVGRENIPDKPCIVMSKHQSAWETLAFQVIFPPQVLVIKKELLRIPFFGWGLAMLSPIAIDRSSGTRALRQIEEQGVARLQQGFWIIIFPEGTRIKPGEKSAYQAGGAWLATHCDAAVLPVALNSGEFWGKNSFLKRPGTITVSIGAAIWAQDMKPGELNAKVEAWIETEMARIKSGES